MEDFSIVWIMVIKFVENLCACNASHSGSFHGQGCYHPMAFSASFH